MDTVNETSNEKKSVNKTEIIPKKENNLRDLAKFVNNKWALMPDFTLLYITQADNETNVNDFSDILDSRIATGSGRTEYTQKLKVLDVDFEKGISEIKVYLTFKYGKKDAPSYYPQFGIIRNQKRFIVPNDRNTRDAAFELIIPALTTHGFNLYEYGTTFWTALKAKYNVDLLKTVTIDGSVSSKVGDKNVLKKQIKKVLNSLIYLIRANYPDTYKTELRSWGFQKEKY